MHIQQYYRLFANTFINGSIAALIPVVLLFYPLSRMFSAEEMIFVFLPFFVYSIISYQLYLMNMKRFTNTKMPTLRTASHSFLEGEQFLFAFMPAPSLRMCFFSPDGFQIGEIRDLAYKKYRWFLPNAIDKLLPSEYGLYDNHNQLLYTVKWKRRIVEISGRRENDHIAIGRSNSLIEIRCNEEKTKKFFITSAFLYTDIQMADEKNRLMARVQKGWMPVEWGQYFKDANTPVLSFDKRICPEERLAFLALLIGLYRYHNH